jgi:hypothetical protein
MLQEYFEVLGGCEVKLPVIASSHDMHCSSWSINPRGTGHGDLQNRSEEIAPLGVLDHTLIAFASPQRIKTQFQ